MSDYDDVYAMAYDAGYSAGLANGAGKLLPTEDYDAGFRDGVVQQHQRLLLLMSEFAVAQLALNRATRISKKVITPGIWPNVQLDALDDAQQAIERAEKIATALYDWTWGRELPPDTEAKAEETQQ